METKDLPELPDVPESAARAVAASFEALVHRYRMSHRLSREQMNMLFLAFATHEAHEIGRTQAQFLAMVNECREEEWETSSVTAEEAAKTAPRVVTDQQVQDLAHLLRPHVNSQQGYLVFLFDYANDHMDGRQVAYCGTVPRHAAALVMEAVLDAWHLGEGLSLEPTHRTVATLRAIVDEFEPHELEGVERHPHMRTPASQVPAEVSAGHLEAAAHHLALFKRDQLEGVRASLAEKAKVTN